MISDEERLNGSGLTIIFDLIDAKYKVRKVRLLSTHKDIISFCKETLAGFKCPKKVVFTELPKTSTGKILKYELRESAKNLA